MIKNYLELAKHIGDYFRNDKQSKDKSTPPPKRGFISSLLSPKD
jgi:hypothetical protein